MKRFLIPALAGALAGCGGDGAGPGGIRDVAVSAPFTTVEIGQSVQLSAAATDASGSVVQGAVLKWTSSAVAIAVVDGTGLVSARAPGTVTITASAGGAAGSLELTVTPPPIGTARVSMPGFSFTPAVTSIRVGQSVLYEFPAEPHNVIFRGTTGAPADIAATSNRTVSRTFRVAGNFPYDCTLHPGMSAEVVVR